jgi:hypothetical protein
MIIEQLYYFVNVNQALCLGTRGIPGLTCLSERSRAYLIFPLSNGTKFRMLTLAHFLGFGDMSGDNWSGATLPWNVTPIYIIDGYTTREIASTEKRRLAMTHWQSGNK